ncbi:MAG: hypothetical protein QM635_08300 [Microbacteriaceae bacterium]
MLIRRIGPRRDGEEGSALIAAVALVFVSALIAVTVASSAAVSSGYATAARAGVQSRAAADAGVDRAYAELEDSSYVCSVSGTDPDYTAEISYYDSSGSALSCSTTVSGTPSTGVIVSTGSADAPGVGDSTRDSTVVRAEVTFDTEATADDDVLTSAVFTGGSASITNSISIIESSSGASDADVYADGNYACSSQNTIYGDLIVTGNITAANNCIVHGDMWAGGYISGNTLTVYGNVYQASTTTLSLTNSGTHIGGSIITNGAVSIAGSTSSCSTSLYYTSAINSTVCGSIVALGGAVAMASGVVVAGSVYAAGTVSIADPSGVRVGTNVVSTGSGVGLSMTNASSQTGVITGSATINGTVSGVTKYIATDYADSCQYGATTPFSQCSAAITSFPTLTPAATLPDDLGYPDTTTVNAPEEQTMPTIGMDADDLALWTDDGWTVVSVASCSAATTYLNSSAKTITTPTVLVASSCSSALSWDSTVNSISDDLAVINPGGFYYTNSAGYKSTSTSYHQLELIVPTGSSGNIIANSLTLTYLYTFLYTPNTITLNNQVTTFYGQIYAGTTFNAPNSSLTMHAMDVPGAVSTSSTSTSSTTTVTLDSRHEADG